MNGLEAIAANNGWAIFVVGVSIVFTGLVLLSFSVAQMHKILAFWDNRKSLSLFQPRKKSKPAPPEIIFSEKEKESARQFYLLSKTLKDSFSIQRILDMAEVSGLEAPHSRLYTLINAKIVAPDNKGFFFWDREMFKKLSS